MKLQTGSTHLLPYALRLKCEECGINSNPLRHKSLFFGFMCTDTLERRMAPLGLFRLDRDKPILLLNFRYFKKNKFKC